MKTIFLAVLFYFVIWPAIKRFMGGGTMDYEQFLQQATEEQRTLAAATILGMRMGAVDGNFDQKEIQALLRSLSQVSFDQQTQRMVEQVVRQVMRGRFSQVDEKQLLQQLDISLTNARARDIVLAVLRDVARADGVIGEIERRYFIHIALLFHLSEKDAEAQLYGKGQRQRQQPPPRGAGSADADLYEVLGLKPGATQAEIKTRYRELARQLHPDRVSHLGGEIEQIVTDKFVRIKEAYEKLSKGV